MKRSIRIAILLLVAFVGCVNCLTAGGLTKQQMAMFSKYADKGDNLTDEELAEAIELYVTASYVLAEETIELIDKSSTADEFFSKYAPAIEEKYKNNLHRFGKYINSVKDLRLTEEQRFKIENATSDMRMIVVDAAKKFN